MENQEFAGGRVAGRRVTAMRIGQNDHHTERRDKRNGRPLSMAAISIDRCSLQKLLRADSAGVTFEHYADRPVRYIRGHTVDQIDSETPRNVAPTVFPVPPD
jgi:hypothetical protein